jgi:hypothetical protein
MSDPIGVANAPINRKNQNHSAPQLDYYNSGSTEASHDTALVIERLEAVSFVSWYMHALELFSFINIFLINLFAVSTVYII